MSIQRLTKQTLGTKGTKAISGSVDITLTSVECRVKTLELLGATQTLTITVPTGVAFTLTNSTDYAQSIKRAGSSKTVLLGAGDTIEVQA